ncbi:helix-turn-helix domain-containing protein [uncultured Bosea sp.]|uniref:helix-turn-helix domain-containing protein n=1 Tax=uncultured Bosea sp. TaxID=211457 RepID=UPI00263ACD43|nr:helix-turn-helix domain-containing protein [uncultured Bosea sp.]
MLLAEDARPEMTPRQAAARLGVTPEALQKLRERGNGPAFFKVGRSVRYDPADIAAYLGRRRVAPANERH